MEEIMIPKETLTEKITNTKYEGPDLGLPMWDFNRRLATRFSGPVTPDIFLMVANRLIGDMREGKNTSGHAGYDKSFVDMGSDFYDILFTQMPYVAKMVSPEFGNAVKDICIELGVPKFHYLSFK